MKVSAGWGYLTYVLYIQVRLIYNKALNKVHFQLKINICNSTDRHQCKLELHLLEEQKKPKNFRLL